MQGKLGILAAGGPAPGINSVIAAATIRARLEGIDVLGLRDGFRWLMQGDVSQVIELTAENVWPIHFTGGSFIGIDRSNPGRAGLLPQTVHTLQRLGVDKLICIGGDGTAYSASEVATEAKGSIRVAHVPKTIDNDLMLPEDIPTFGFQTARHVGVHIVHDLRIDAVTTSRWYFIVTMGRQAGHLALGIGKAADATITLIPEEFPVEVPLERVVDTLAGAVLKRLANGRMDGIAVIAEGLSERIDRSDMAKVLDPSKVDSHGKPILAEVNLAQLLQDAVEQRLASLPGKVKATIRSRNVGYELRCTDPIPFDLEYTRDLGYSATKYLLEGGDQAMITIQRGRFVPVPFSDFIDATSRRSRVRNVDIKTESYSIARRYMTRLGAEDFRSTERLQKLADITGLSVDDFRNEFAHVIDDDPAPLSYTGIPPAIK